MKKVIKLSVVFMAIIIFGCSLAGCRKRTMLEPGAASIDELIDTLSENDKFSDEYFKVCSNTQLVIGTLKFEEDDVSSFLRGDADEKRSILKENSDSQDYYLNSRLRIDILDYSPVSVTEFYNYVYEMLDEVDELDGMNISAELRELIDAESGACDAVYKASGNDNIAGEKPESWSGCIIKVNDRYYILDL